MDKGLLLFYDWEVALDSLDGDEFKKLILAMLRYKHHEEEPPEFEGTTKIIASILLPQVQRELESINFGKKGGRPKKASADTPATAKEDKKAEKKSPEPTTDAKSEKSATVTSPSVTKSNEKKKYGEFGNVLLTDEEHEKLMAKFPNDCQSRIDDLSFYIKSKGDNYSSHYATILYWDRNKKVDSHSASYSSSSHSTSQKPGVTSTFDTDDFFQAALERSRREIDIMAAKQKALEELEKMENKKGGET